MVNGWKKVWKGKGRKRWNKGNSSIIVDDKAVILYVGDSYNKVLKESKTQLRTIKYAMSYMRKH